MKVDIIYILCYKYDQRLTRILVASIRAWYPTVRVSLIKDRWFGDFDTRELERKFGCSVLKTQQKCFGWGFSHLEALLQPQKERCLILDSDTVLTGPVLELLESYDEEFVVHHEDPTADFVKSNYFHLEPLQELDRGFTFPGFTFNAGQIVATTGILKRADFDPFIRWGNPPEVQHPEVFKLGDQGLLNYVVMKKHQLGEISLRRLRFMEVAESNSFVDANYLRDREVNPNVIPMCEQVRVEKLTGDSPYRFVMHWCGLKRPRLEDMPRSDILLHFQTLYYARIRFGRFRKWLRWLSSELENTLRANLRKCETVRKSLKALQALCFGERAH